MVDRTETSLPGVVLIEPKIHGDQRGFFMESYNRRAMAAIGIADDFVQDNHSKSGFGVLRGLHYQLAVPQAKLVRVTRGRVFDVAVDIRRGSPDFGRWAGVELSDENQLMLYIPAGFAHGFLVLSEIAEFQYKCSDFYAPEDEHGVAWNDPSIGIEWPLKGLDPVLSDRDLGWCNLDEMEPDQLPDYST
jgi:dTDP-4-dehydrorhamnose 3,5-epimerase